MALYCTAPYIITISYVRTYEKQGLTYEYMTNQGHTYVHVRTYTL